eukprot:650790-Prorocentrum_minimum.AAC.2
MAPQLVEMINVVVAILSNKAKSEGMSEPGSSCGNIADHDQGLQSIPVKMFLGRILQGNRQGSKLGDPIELQDAEPESSDSFVGVTVGNVPGRPSSRGS